MRCCLALVLALARAQIVSIVTTDSGVQRGATAAELPAYEAYNNAVAASRAGDVEAAIALLEEALRIKPDLPEAHINLANLLGDKKTVKGELDDGASPLAHYEAALACADDPSLRAQALSNIGHAMHRSARGGGSVLQAALERFEEAVLVAPDFVDAHFNMGALLQELGRSDDAKAAYEATLQLEPKHETARLNLANLYFAEGDSNTAARLQMALVRDPELSLRTRIDALNNLGQTYRDAGDHLKAADLFRDARELEGAGDVISLSNLVTALRTLCDWEQLEALQLELLSSTRDALDKFWQGVQNGAIPSRRSSGLGLMPYDATLMGCTPNNILTNLTSAHLLSRFGAPSTSQRLRRRRRSMGLLRVGYLSYDFREHPMGYLTRRLLDPAPNLEITALSYGDKDNSTVRQRAESSILVELREAAVTEAKAAMSPIEVVVDLMAHTRGARLELASLATPPAAVLINYLGYPGTGGGGRYDFTVADRVVAPVEAVSSQFAEPIILLPNAASYQTNDYGLLWPPARLLGEGSIELCNYNQMDKFEPVSFALWMNVLRRTPRATLTLLRPSEALANLVIPRLAKEAAARGVLPSRIKWASRVSKREHLERMQDCVCFLDHLTYGAHTTAADALWAGVPLLTVRGFGGGDDDLFGRFSSRVGASLLGSLNLGYLAVDSARDLEDLTVRFGHSPILSEAARRAVLGATLREGSLFDAKLSKRRLESAYAAAVETRQLFPGRFHVVLVDDPPRETPSPRDCAVADLGELLQDSYTGPACHIADLDAAEHARTGADPLYDTGTLRLGASLRLSLAYPRDPDARHMRGLALHVSGEHEEAAREMKMACFLSPTTPHFWSNLGHVLSNKAAAFLTARRVADVHHAPQNQEHATLSAAIVDQLTRGIESGETRGVEAVRDLFAASLLTDDDPKLGLRLGAALDDVGDASGAMDEWSRAVITKHSQHEQDDFGFAEAALAREQRGSRRLSVAFYCDEYGQSWWKGWGPSSLLNLGGLGGSEEAVVFVTRELAKRGPHVEVYLEDISSEDLGPDSSVEEGGLHWLPLATYSSDEPADVFVAWRYHISAALGLASGARTFVWLQDVPPFTSWTPGFVNQLKGVLTLSKFHTRTLPGHARAVAKETPNGIDPAYYADGPNNARTFAYGSAPNRGLYDLLRLWNQTIYPDLQGDARLVVYYGFSKSFVKWGQASMPGYSDWEARMHELLNQPGVDYRGMVDHATLAHGYAEAGFVLYPTTYPETGCVTVMKAMANGAIPITSKHAESVVPELTRHFDLGPAESRRASSSTSNRLTDDPEDARWLDSYASAVVEAVHRAERGELEAHRRSMILDARERFAWRHVAKLMDDAFT